jgi:hypothetical protein
VKRKRANSTLDDSGPQRSKAWHHRGCENQNALSDWSLKENLMSTLKIRVLFAGASLLFFTSNAASGAQHVHGAARLQVAVDGERLTLEFSSPLDSLVGFERAPRTDKERAALKDMMARLQQPEALFTPSPAARCVRASVQIDAPFDAKPGKATAKAEQSEHAALTAEVVFKCERWQDLKGLNAAIFDAFPRLKRIEAHVAGAKKQVAAKLTARDRQLAW